MSNKSYIKDVDKICIELGPTYATTVIDNGYVISKDLKNGYDFEISILEPSRLKFSAVVYVWYHKSDIVEQVGPISSISFLCDKLTELTIKYGKTE